MSAPVVMPLFTVSKGHLYAVHLLWEIRKKLPEQEHGASSSSTPQFNSVVVTGPGQDVLSVGFIQNRCRFLEQLDKLKSHGP